MVFIYCLHFTNTNNIFCPNNNNNNSLFQTFVHNYDMHNKNIIIKNTNMKSINEYITVWRHTSMDVIISEHKRTPKYLVLCT